MRRAEFNITNPEAINQTLAEIDYGVLSLISDGEPYGVAVNFAFADGAIYFHGAKEGRKVEAIGEGAVASFVAVKPYAFIPSYFSDSLSACPASQYFASVHLFGVVEPLDDGAQKAHALTQLMQKMQPEGGYQSIDEANPIYTKMLSQTAVFKLTPKTISLKVKAGQNLSHERKAGLIEKLEARGESETAEKIKELS